ncbi:MAG: Holliday junction resolvase Hjc [Nitrososphaerota archaeon]
MYKDNVITVYRMPKKPKDVLSPRYKARIGYESEYTLVKKLVSRGWPGWYAIRTPGSGSGKMAKPDVIAVENGELYAIEVKSSRKSYVMLNREQVKRLLEFCRMFRLRCPHCGEEFTAKPVVAVRFMGYGWEFIQVPEETDRPIIIKRKPKDLSS